MSEETSALIAELNRCLAGEHALPDSPRAFTRELLDRIHDLGSFRVFIPPDCGVSTSITAIAWRSSRRRRIIRWSFRYRSASPAAHLERLLRTDELAAASALLRRHLAWALETRSLDYRFCFLLASRSLLRRWIAAATTRIQLRLPESLCPLANQGSVGTQASHDWIEPQLQSLSSQFDARNGNRYFTEQWAAADGQVPSSQAA